MAKSKSNAEWLKIFKSFERSGLSVMRFCKQNGISASSFYVKRRELKNKMPSSTPNFLPVEIVDEPGNVSPSSATIVINVKRASLSLPADTSASFFLVLLKGLS